MLFVACLPGCGGDDKLIDIPGTVMRDGKPVPNVTVHFEPHFGRPSWGKTDEKGNFTLSYDPQNKGLEIGKHRVWVEFRVQSPDEEIARQKGTWKVPEDIKEIQGKYGNRNMPALEVEVVRGMKRLEIILK
jgi:hypothetical protein